MDPKSENSAITMSEYLEDMIKLEKAANSFLEKDESKQCTYSKGQITQTVYGCHTCNKKAGICLACYINCHSEHETFEVGLKRNFRCDCGTPIFEDHPCCLAQDYREENKNSYDHNFEAKWCICNEPYDANIFMIRCLHCLEYYHIHHLGLSEDLQNVIEDNENMTTMICGDCYTTKYKFLRCQAPTFTRFTREELLDEKVEKQEVARPEEPFNISLGKRSRSKEEECLIEEQLKSLPEIEKEPVFLKDGWRNHLCFCDACQKLYKDLGVFDIVTQEEEEEPEVVVDENVKNEIQETQVIRNFDSNIKSNASTVLPEDNTVYSAALKEMSKLDFFTQSHIATIYRGFYEDFKDFLDQFKDQDVVITEQHVNEFFKGLKDRKSSIAESDL